MLQNLQRMSTFFNRKTVPSSLLFRHIQQHQHQQKVTNIQYFYFLVSWKKNIKTQFLNFFLLIIFIKICEDRSVNLFLMKSLRVREEKQERRGRWENTIHKEIIFEEIEKITFILFVLLLSIIVINVYNIIYFHICIVCTPSVWDYCSFILLN